MEKGHLGERYVKPTKAVPLSAYRHKFEISH